MTATAKVRGPDGDHAVHSMIGTGVIARFVGTGLAMVSGVATTSIAVRLLGSSAYGILAFAASTGALVAGLARLGLEPGLARAITSMRAGGSGGDVASLTRGAVALNTAGGLLAAIFVVALVPLVDHGAGIGVTLVVAGSIAVYTYAANTAAITGAIARGLGLLPLMEVPNVTLSLGRLAAVVVVAAVGLGTLGWVAGAWFASGVLTLAVCLVLARRLTHGLTRPLRPEVGAGRDLLRLSLPFAVTGVATVALSRVDVVVLGLTHDSAVVGEYEPTLKLVEQALLWAPTLFIGPFLPVATRLHTIGDERGFRALYAGNSKLVYVAAFPAVLLLATAPVQTLHVVFGSGYAAHETIVWILLGGFVVNLAFGLNTNALAAWGARRALIRVGLVGLVSMVTLACALVPPFGAVGAAAATALTYAIVNTTASVLLHRASQVLPFDRSMAITVATSALAVALLAAGGHAVGEQGFPVSLAGTMAVWAIWLGVLRLTGSFSWFEVGRLAPWRSGT